MKTTSFSLVRIFIYALIISSLVLSLSPGVGPAAFAQSEQPATGSGGNPTPPPPVTTTDAETGLVRYMGGSKLAPLALTSAADAAAKSPREIAEGFLQARGTAFGLAAGSGLSVLRETSATDGRTFERFQQTYQGVPILGGELIVQMDAGKNVLSTSGQVSSGLNLSVTPALDAAAGQAAALAATREQYPEVADLLTPSEAILSIYDTQIYDRQSVLSQKLVWQVIVSTADPADGKKSVEPVRQNVMVDAQSGEIVRQYSTLDTALYRAIIDCGWGCYLVRQEGSTDPTGDTDDDNAYDYLGDTYNFYWNHYGRDSINAKGMKLWAVTHYADAYQNAAWTGSIMLFGDGMAADDVTAHELTHGVTQYESKLAYVDQSGAINESFSDTWGEWVDQTNGKGTDTAAVKWLMGEDVTGMGAPLGQGAIRSMQDPTIYYDPDKTSSPYYYCGFGDNGGVHMNSGVGNKAAYLITDGGDFNGYHIDGLGITKAAKIYYDVQTNLLTSKAEYPDLADALDNACSSLTGPQYGITPDDCANVHKAIVATEMNKTPCIGARGYMNSTSTFVYAPIGNIGTELHPTLDWRQQASATSYLVTVKDSKGQVVYNPSLANDTIICATAHCQIPLPSALKYGEHYTWSVVTHNLFGDGPRSPTKAFYTTVPAAAPAQIIPSDPIDGATVGSALPVFTWPPVDGASSYVLKINQLSPVSKTYLSMTLKPETTCLPGNPCSVASSKALVPGQYQWTIQAKFGTQSGPENWFTLNVNPLPDKVTITAPTEGQLAIPALAPSATWSFDGKATNYLVTILGTAGKVVQTYNASGCTLLNGCSILLPQLDGGKQIMTVQAFNGVGKALVSDKRTFSIAAPSGSVPLYSPADSPVPLGTSRPVFQWGQNPLATTYTLQVSGPTPFKKIVKFMDVCSAAVCQTASDVTLKPGAYTWTVAAVNKAGTVLSTAWSFTAPSAALAPAAPLLTAPPTKSIVASNVPLAFGWTDYSGGAADQMILKLSGPNHFVDQQIFSTVDVCPTSACSWTYHPTNPLAIPLAMGPYTWTVTASNHGVLSKSSAAFSFSIGLPAPNILTPSGVLPESLYQVNATWQPLTGARAYNVQLLDGANKTILNKTYLVSQVCTASTCTAPLTAGLIPGPYQLLVKGLSATGFGVTAIRNFAFTRVFDAEFNNSYDGWSDVGPTGHWYLSSNHKYFSNTGRYWGEYPSWELISDGNSYGNVDIQYSVQRLGIPGFSTGVFIRGTVAPVTNKFTNGYLFNITTDGWFSVWREYTDSFQIHYEEALQPWTKTALIHKGAAFNTVRVVAVDGKFAYYINGKLAWVGVDSYFSFGQAYLGMYSWYPGDELNIDWAHGYTAQPSTIGTGFGALDTEQQALNQAAAAQPAGGNPNHDPTVSGK